VPANEQDAPEPSPPREESTGNTALDRRLEKGVVDFDRGIDTAQVWVSAFLVLITGLVVFLGVFGVPFQGAEVPRIVQNTALHRVTTFLDALSEEPAGPIALLSYAVNWSLTPGLPWGFRAVSLVLHLLNAVLLYLFARRLLGPGTSEPVAMTAGLLFAVHPLAAESVACAFGRPGLLALWFALLSALLFFRATDVEGMLRMPSFAASLACYALAFAAEPAAAALPVVLLWAEWVRGGIPRLRVWSAVHGVYFAAFVALLIVRLASVHDDGAAAYLRAPGELLGGLMAYMQQLLLHVCWPVSLSPIAPDAGRALFSTLGAGVLACLVASVIALLAVRGAGGIALLWPLAAACAAVCLIPADDLLSGRRAYFALAGFALLAPCLFSVFTHRILRIALGLAISGLVLVSSVVSYQRVAVWADPPQLWAAAAETAPSDARPWEYLGTLASAAAQTASGPEQARTSLIAAERCWQEALKRRPDYVPYLVHFGTTLRQLGKNDAAMTVLKDALRRAPSGQGVALQLGVLCELEARDVLVAAFDEIRMRAGWPPRLGEEFRASLRERPWAPETSAQLALLYEAWARAGHDIESLRLAADYFARAESLGQLPPEALAQYAAVLAGLGDAESCARLLREAAEAAPNDVIAAVRDRFSAVAREARETEARGQELLAKSETMGEGLFQTAEAALLRGTWTRAAYLYEAAVEKRPDEEKTWLGLGYLRACMRGADAFVQQHGAAAAATPQAWNRLAARCMAAGLWESAEMYLARDPALGDEVQRLLALGELAVKARQPERGNHYFDQAVNARPDDPAAWLRLCDIAIELEDVARAAQYLREAEKRGAAPEAVTARREKVAALGGSPAPAETEPRTIIR